MVEDKIFLQWIHDRLQHVHGENPFYDYMHKLRAIINATPEDKVTPNIASFPESAVTPMIGLHGSLM